MTNAEIDRRIAVEVMGLNIDGMCDGEMTDYANGSCWSCNKCGAYDDHGPFEHKPVVRDYSTNINRAMELVEKIRGPMRLDYNHISGIWRVKIGDMRDINKVSLPMAISLAALAWAEAKKGTQ